MTSKKVSKKIRDEIAIAHVRELSNRIDRLVGEYGLQVVRQIDEFNDAEKGGVLISATMCSLSYMICGMCEDDQLETAHNDIIKSLTEMKDSFVKDKEKQ